MPRIADPTFLKEEKVIFKRAINIIIAFIQKDTGILQDDIASLLGFSLSHLKRLKSEGNQTNVTRRNISQICRVGITETALFEIGKTCQLSNDDQENIRLFFSNPQFSIPHSGTSSQSIEKYCKPSMINELESFGYQKLLDANHYKNGIIFWSILERDLIRFAIALSTKYARIAFSNKISNSLIEDNVFIYDGESFSITRAPHKENEKLCFSIQKKHPTKNTESIISNKYLLNESAKYRELTIETQNVPKPCYDVFEELLNIIIDKTYCFLDNACLEHNSFQPLSVTNQLYALCRSSMPVKQPFWLYLMHSEGAIYLFDSPSKKNALKSISGLGQEKNLSRSDCLVRMMCQQSSSRDVVDANKVIPSNKSTQYHSIQQASKISMISYPQHLMMGEGLMTIRPLVGTEVGCIYENDVSWLTVVYAEKNNNGKILENHFNKLRHKLALILQSHQHSVSAHLRSDNGRLHYT